jgi:hypothetical protein
MDDHLVDLAKNFDETATVCEWFIPDRKREPEMSQVFAPAARPARPVRL